MCKQKEHANRRTKEHKRKNPVKTMT